MRRDIGGPHTHPCATDGCRQKAECHGYYSLNWDGIPEAVCSVYHEELRCQMFCETCQELRDRPQCDECGEQVELNDKHLCAGCDAIRLSPTGTDPRRI